MTFLLLTNFPCVDYSRNSLQRRLLGRRSNPDLNPDLSSVFTQDLEDPTDEEPTSYPQSHFNPSSFPPPYDYGASPTQFDPSCLTTQFDPSFLTTQFDPKSPRSPAPRSTFTPLNLGLSPSKSRPLSFPTPLYPTCWPSTVHSRLVPTSTMPTSMPRYSEIDSLPTSDLYLMPTPDNSSTLLPTLADDTLLSTSADGRVLLSTPRRLPTSHVAGLSPSLPQGPLTPGSFRSPTSIPLITSPLAFREAQLLPMDQLTPSELNSCKNNPTMVTVCSSSNNNKYFNPTLPEPDPKPDLEPEPEPTETTDSVDILPLPFPPSFLDLKPSFLDLRPSLAHLSEPSYSTRPRTLRRDFHSNLSSPSASPCLKRKLFNHSFIQILSFILEINFLRINLSKLALVSLSILFKAHRVMCSSKRFPDGYLPQSICSES